MFNSTYIRGTGLCTVERNWLECLKIHWSDVHCVKKEMLQKILQRYNSVIQNG